MYLAICFCHDASEVFTSNNGCFVFFPLFSREAVTLFSRANPLRLKIYIYYSSKFLTCGQNTQGKKLTCSKLTRYKSGLI
jgi:hypothetical protein